MYTKYTHFDCNWDENAKTPSRHFGYALDRDVRKRASESQEQGMHIFREYKFNYLRRQPQSKSVQSSFFEKLTRDKMLLLSVQNMPFSTWRNCKKSKGADEKISRIKSGGIDFVWENGFAMQTGN
jgi:hypothetical protein